MPAATAPSRRATRERTRLKRPRAEERSRVEEVQRARLVAATLQAAAATNVANVTVADIVAVAGVSRRTFYEIYPNVEECLLDALEVALQRAGSAIATYREADGSWQDRLRVALTSLLAFFEQEPEIAALLLLEWPHCGDAALRRRSETVMALEAALEEGRNLSRNGRVSSRNGASPSGNGLSSRSAGEAPHGGGELSALTAEALVGAVAFVVGERLRQRARKGSLTQLVPALMSLIVMPYLGRAAARKELQRPAEPSSDGAGGRSRKGRRHGATPATQLRDVHADEPWSRDTALRVLSEPKIRLTYRTLKVLSAVAESPGASNRAIADAAGIVDQGQASKLLSRLQRSGLVENVKRKAAAKGEPNSWRLTAAGEQMQRTLPAMR